MKDSYVNNMLARSASAQGNVPQPNSVENPIISIKSQNNIQTDQMTNFNPN